MPSEQDIPEEIEIEDDTFGYGSRLGRGKQETIASAVKGSIRGAVTWHQVPESGRLPTRHGG